jgi:protein-disulfide isomerase
MFAALGAGCRPSRPPVPPPANAPRKGPANARFVLQEIGDYECPFCADVQPDVKQVLALHGAEIALVWRNYPLRMHPHAALAAEAAVEVKKQLGDEGFWHYHDTLFANQAALGQAELEHYASALGGVDMQRFVTALTERTHRAEVEADRRAIDALQIERLATPAFLFAGDVLVGSYPYESFLSWIEDRM